MSLGPIHGEIEHGPFAHPYMKAIYKKFGRAAFGRNSSCMEFNHFLQSINPSGKVCLEIGTFHGITAALLSQYFDKVISISVDVDPEKLLKDKIIKHLGIGNVVFYDVRNNDEKKAIIDKLEFDFCYMDGNHARDTKDDFALVGRCGRVLFHEYWPLQPPVWNLVNSLPPDEVRKAQFDCFAYWQCAT